MDCCDSTEHSCGCSVGGIFRVLCGRGTICLRNFSSYHCQFDLRSGRCWIAGISVPRICGSVYRRSTRLLYRTRRGSVSLAESLGTKTIIEAQAGLSKVSAIVADGYTDSHMYWASIATHPLNFSGCRGFDWFETFYIFDVRYFRLCCLGSRARDSGLRCKSDLSDCEAPCSAY